MERLNNRTRSITATAMIHQIMSPISAKKTPQTPLLPLGLIQGSKGVIAVVKRVVLDPLPWCNAPELTTEPTKLRLPGIKNLYFYCFIASL
jgi:hypothetical protein